MKIKKSELYKIIGVLLSTGNIDVAESFQICHLTPPQRQKKKIKRRTHLASERAKDRSRYHERKSRKGPIDRKISRALKKVIHQRKRL